MNRPAILTRPGAITTPQQNLALFRIYVAYRSLLSVVLLIMLISPNPRQLVGSLNPTLYASIALAHLATSVPLVGSVSRHLNQRLMLLVFITDIVAITLMGVEHIDFYGVNRATSLPLVNVDVPTRFFFIGAPPGLYSLIEGVAAGAMLTMIAQTMLPEAYFKGGSITGFATMLGFLAAIFFQKLDPAHGGH